MADFWKILMVDDDFSTRKLINRILHRRALLDHAINGAEAILAYEMSQEHVDPYDLIMLDVTLPDMEGVEILKHIRRYEEVEEIKEEDRVPIIMVTGRKDTMMKSFSEGCTEYLLKPFKPNELLATVKALVEN